VLGIVADIAALLVFVAAVAPCAGRGIAITRLPRGIDSLDAAPPSVI